MMADGLSQDEALLSESALEAAAALGGCAPADWRESWKALVELGWPGVLAPEADGGFGGSLTDLLLLCRAAGKALLKTPLAPDAAVAARLLDQASPAQRERYLGPHLSGRSRAALAHQEFSGDPEAEYVRARAERKNGGYVLNCAKRMVLYGADSETLIVSAMDSAHLRLFFAPRSAVGVETKSYALIDGTEAADFQFNNVAVHADAVFGGEAFDARPLLTHTMFAGVLALVGEGIGCVEAALAQSVQHLLTRHQFGAPLASFQVLRHRIADMYVIREELFSLGLAAARANDSERPAAIRTAKIYLGQAGVWAAEQAVQMHGAMGVTEDCMIGNILKRMVVLDRLFGGADHHLARLGADLL